LVVKYEYTVDGNRRIGEGAGMNAPVVGTKEAETLESRYRAGIKVAVYYDPKKPEASLLVPGQVG
jgi:hypothetical protein